MEGGQAVIADAPYIREAENDGVGCSETPICPVCYKEAERFYVGKGTRDILGCENCIDWEVSWFIEEDRE